MTEHVWTALVSVVTGGSLLKIIQLIFGQRHDNQEFLNKQMREMFEEERKTTAKKQKFADKMEEEFVSLKLKYTEKEIEILKLQAEHNRAVKECGDCKLRTPPQPSS